MPVLNAVGDRQLWAKCHIDFESTKDSSGNECSLDRLLYPQGLTMYLTDADLTDPWQAPNVTRRSSSNFNAEILKAHRKEMKAKRNFVWKQVATDRFIWRRLMSRDSRGRTYRGQWLRWKVTVLVWKLLPEKSKSKNNLRSKLKPNNLFFFQSRAKKSSDDQRIAYRALTTYAAIDNPLQMLQGSYVVRYSGNWELWHLFTHRLVDNSTLFSFGWLWDLIDADYFRAERDAVFRNIHLPGLLERSTAKLLDKIKNQKLDLATDLAEIAQVTGMISSAAVALGKSFLSLKKGKIPDAIRAIIPQTKNEAASMFLAYRYGVHPLLSDIEGAAQHLAERVHNIEPTKVMTKLKTKIFDTVNSSLPSNDGNGIIKEVRRKRELSVKKVCHFGISDIVLRDLSRLGFSTPTKVVWELVPFSFVVDWFLPIGNYLGRLSALEGVQLKDYFMTITQRETIMITVDLSGLNTTIEFLDKQNSLILEVENVDVNRVILPITNLVGSIALPQWKNPFSVGHVANAIALLTQMFSKGK